MMSGANPIGPAARVISHCYAPATSLGVSYSEFLIEGIHINIILESVIECHTVTSPLVFFCFVL